MNQFIELFFEMMQAERGASENTLKSYSSDLVDFISFQGNKIEKTNVSQIKKYVEYLRLCKASSSTINRRLSCLRQFFQFLYKENLIDYDPTSTISISFKNKALPKYLTEKEIKELLSCSRQDKTPNGIRGTAIAELLYSSGLRVSELVSLPLSSIRRERPVIVVTGKSKKERIVPIGIPAKNALYNYLDKRFFFLPSSARASSWLFPSRGQKGHLTRNTVSLILKKIGELSGISSKRVSAHIIRHSFASHLLANGADLRTLQQMLGHADISTTQIYTHILDDKLIDTVEHNHPLSVI